MKLEKHFVFQCNNNMSQWANWTQINFFVFQTENKFTCTKYNTNVLVWEQTKSLGKQHTRASDEFTEFHVLLYIPESTRFVSETHSNMAWKGPDMSQISSHIYALPSAAIYPSNISAWADICWYIAPLWCLCGHPLVALVT